MKREFKIMLCPSIMLGMLLLCFAGCKNNDGATNPDQGLPVVKTVALTKITGAGAVSGGSITSDGGSAITARGVCWGTNQTPTIADSKTSDGSGTGTFTSNISGFTQSTTYYVRAYATNSAGTSYGAALAVIPPTVTYYGQAFPGETPVLFAPAKLNSLSGWVEATDLSPDGTQFFAAVGNADYSGGKLYYSKCVNNVWSAFTEAPFISGFVFSNEPVFSADGTSLIFTGKKSAADNLDLWSVTYIDQTWGVPVKLPSPINSNANDFRASFMSDGTLYFSSGRVGGMNQVYKGTIQPPTAELLGAPINANAYEGDPCIAPDGHFLVFHSGRNGVSTDLCVSFSDGHGGWKTPVFLGAQFNSSSDEYGAHLSSDGKYLFYTRHTAAGNQIYWVAVSAIDKLQ